MGRKAATPNLILAHADGRRVVLNVERRYLCYHSPAACWIRSLDDFQFVTPALIYDFYARRGFRVEKGRLSG